jgi:hypothetical protein
VASRSPASAAAATHDTSAKASNQCGIQWFSSSDASRTVTAVSRCGAEPNGRLVGGGMGE